MSKIEKRLATVMVVVAVVLIGTSLVLLMTIGTLAVWPMWLAALLLLIGAALLFARVRDAHDRATFERDKAAAPTANSARKAIGDRYLYPR